MSEITFEDKEDKKTSGLQNKNKVTASDMNEIKESVNALYLIESAKPKIYKALLTQNGTDAPVATILENTLGDIVWTRLSEGTYLATLEGSFPLQTKIYTLFGAIESQEQFLAGGWNDVNSIYIYTYQIGLANLDGLLSTPTPIQIEVYP